MHEEPYRWVEAIANRREYIEDQLDASPTLEQMAAVARLSPYHFARQFKTATGLPPHQYVIARRVERAKQLLQGGGDLSLAEVAAHAGFSDQSQFCQHFKRLVGVTPGQFYTQYDFYSQYTGDPDGGQPDPEVLEMEGDLEPERVVVLDHPSGPVGEDPALGRPTAQRAVRHHGHQHQHREHQRNAGERILAEKTHEVGLDHAHESLHHQHDDRRRRELQQCRDDRTCEQAAKDLAGRSTGSRIGSRVRQR